MNEEERLEPVGITIGDQTFRVRVAPEERERVLRVAEAANRALREIVEGGVIGGPRALAMTVFQLAYEMEDLRAALRERKGAAERLDRLVRRLDEAVRRVRVPGV